MASASYIARKQRIGAILARTTASRAAIAAFIASPDEPVKPEEIVIELPRKSINVALPQTAQGHQTAFHRSQLTRSQARRSELLERYRPLSEIVRTHVKKVLSELGGNISHASVALRVDRGTIYRAIADDPEAV